MVQPEKCCAVYFLILSTIVAGSIARIAVKSVGAGVPSSLTPTTIAPPPEMSSHQFAAEPSNDDLKSRTALSALASIAGMLASKDYLVSHGSFEFRSA
jgi:hypothetical protein